MYLAPAQRPCRQGICTEEEEEGGVQIRLCIIYTH